LINIYASTELSVDALDLQTLADNSLERVYMDRLHGFPGKRAAAQGRIDRRFSAAGNNFDKRIECGIELDPRRADEY
jgi:hypothetical protein